MRTLFKLSILAVSALHLFGPLLPFDPTYAVFLSSLVSLLSGVGLIGGTFRIVTVVFLLAGSALLVSAGAGPRVWASAFGSMTNIIAVIVVLQLFSLPLALGGYQESILRWVRRGFRRQRSLFLFTSVLTHALASFLSFGAVPVAVELLEKTLKQTVDRFDRFTAAAASRGYALSALWAPGAINVFLVLQATGLEWSELFVPGLVLGILGIALSQLLETVGKPDRVLAPESSAAAAEPARSPGSRRPAPARHILAVTAVFLVIVYAAERAGFGAVYNRIICSGALVSLGWLALLTGGGKVCGAAGLRSVFTEYWRSGLLKAGDLAPFFIAMGAFSAGLEGSGLLDSAGPALAAAAEAAGPSGLIAVPAAVVLLGMAGIHPFITIVLIGKILRGADLPVPPVTTALLLASGGVVSYLLSPFTGIIMTIAKLVGASAFDVAVRWNWAFCLLFAVAGTAFSFAWGFAFG